MPDLTLDKEVQEQSNNKRHSSADSNPQKQKQMKENKVTLF